ncbi:putative D,D-dipeptide transport ATP-binding protein DdpD [Nocardia cerradoensis]|uniref:Putative D,D-dipeptide transport ATP-binding protein DdpD n=1 Tax=Nocardia cerradoensis TaxID=85688 RepID=A0A231GUW6_9NOCA|nr:ABC transporter ATP-binding protein [Nocardia cerradoensis]OXR40396.1 putative D,D-dipeptide transport ATP-binding protein DdpD [Nocardia cerradoensis]
MSLSDDPTGTPVLRVEGLNVDVAGGRRALRDVSFEIRRGETVALVGESGSGKTLTCRAVLGLLPPSVEITSGTVTLGSGESAVDLTAARPATWRRLRGIRLSAVFQDPGSYLNPSLTIGYQVAEQLRVRGSLGRRAARDRGRELLRELGIHDAERVERLYPFQLSGGMLQRVLIAVAISLDPELLIADEATTALDTVVQAEILELLERLQRHHRLSLLLVTHDLAVVARTSHRVMVMYAGELVESGPTEEVLRNARHPYTQALLRVASLGDWSRRTLKTIDGQPPAAGEEISGCRFAARCPHAGPGCADGAIPLREVGSDHLARCVRDRVAA